MIDLHLHTVYSDGKIASFNPLSCFCDYIAVTDHNTIASYNKISYEGFCKKIIIGCEVTVDRAPDYLVYFTNSSVLDFENIERTLLSDIRMNEERVIKQCYDLFGYKQWEYDKKRAFDEYTQIHSLRTRDLAAIMYLYDNNLEYANGYFTPIQLKKARKLRNEYAEKYGNPVPEEYAFSLANKYKGELVFAHPIHTAIKKCGKTYNRDTVTAKLMGLIESFCKNGGNTLEWEFFSHAHFDRYLITLNDISEIRNEIKVCAEKNNLKFTIGSDSHSLENFSEYISWYSENISYVESKFPDWIINH